MVDDLILDEASRTKLDGIVQQMEANQEADADIQFVVSDFKQKYGVKKKDNTIIVQKNGLQNTSPLVSTSQSGSNKAVSDIVNFQIPVTQKNTGSFSLNRNVSTKPTPKDVLGKGTVVPTTVTNATKNEYQVDLTDKSADATKTQVEQTAQIQNDVDTGVLEQRNKSTYQGASKDFKDKATEIAGGDLIEYSKVLGVDDDMLSRVDDDDKQIYQTNEQLKNLYANLDIYNTRGDVNNAKQIQKSIDEAEKVNAELMLKRNSQLDAEILQMQKQFNNGITYTKIPQYNAQGVYTHDEYEEKPMSDDEKTAIKSQIESLKKRKGAFLQDTENPQEVFQSLQPKITMYEKQNIIPKDASSLDKMRIYYGIKLTQLNELKKKKEVEGKEATPANLLSKSLATIGGGMLAPLSDEITSSIKQRFVDDRTTKSIQEIEGELNAIAPILANNLSPNTKKNGFWKTAKNEFVDALSATNTSNTSQDNAQFIQKATQEAGVNLTEDRQKELALQQKGKDYAQNNERFGQTIGNTAEFALEFGVTSALGEGLINYGAKLLKATLPAKAYVGVNMANNALRETKLGNLVLGATDEAIKYEVAGALNKQLKDDATASQGATGFLGSELGEKFAKPIATLFGANGGKFISLLGDTFGRTVVELFEETGQNTAQLVNQVSGDDNFITGVYDLFKDSEKGKEFISKLKENYSDADENVQFVASIFAMSFAFNAGKFGKFFTDLALSKKNELSETDKEKVDVIIDDLSNEYTQAQQKAVEETAKAQGKTEEEVLSEIQQASAVNIQSQDFGGETIQEAIDSNLENNISEVPKVEETFDVATAIPASEMTQEQVDLLYENKIANPTEDEELNTLESRLRKKKQNEVEITPNEFIEQRGVENVGEGLQGEYQNVEGVQQGSGIGQVSGQEVPTEKVEEGVEPQKEILSTKSEEITKEKLIEVDRNVDSDKSDTKSLKFITHKREEVSGKKLTDALNKVADDMVESAKKKRKQFYADHVTEKQKDDILKKEIERAEEVRKGENINNLGIAQSINYELTGVSVPILPNENTQLRDTDVPQLEALKDVVEKPKVGDILFDTKKGKGVTILKVSKPQKGSALENEPYIIDIKYSDGTKAINMPIGDRFKIKETTKKQNGDTLTNEVVEKGKNPNATTTPKQKEQNSQSNFIADLSDENNSIESKILAIDSNIKKYGAIDNGSKSLIKRAIEKVDGLSVNNIFDIASRIAKFDKSEIRIEQIAEAIQYEVGRVENEKDVFSISLDDIQETLLSKYKQETPANKERMNDIGIADKTYTDRSDKLKSIKKTYELLSAESKALTSQFIKRYYDTIKDDAKFTADEYLDLIDNIIKGKKIEDIAENIQNAIRVIEDKEAIELNKLPPIKEPLKDVESTTEALRRLTSNELNKIPLYSKQSVEKMIDENLQKNKEVRINIPFGSLYGLPDKVMTVVLNKDNTIVFLDKNGKETKGIRFDRKKFNDFAFDVAKDQYKSQDSISKAYHKAKVDGSNPELVKAVEDALAPQTENTKINEEQSTNADKVNTNEKIAEISPNKNVSDSKESAIKDITKKDSLFPDLTPTEALYLSEMTEPILYDDAFDWKDGNKPKDKRAEYIVRLKEKGYVDERQNIEEGTNINDDLIVTEKGKKFQDALSARQETRKGIKEGTDLFPKDAGLSGKELVADALDRIADKIGSKKNLTEQERTSLTKDISDLAKGLIQMGSATLDNVIDKIKEAIKKRVPELDDKEVDALANNIEDDVIFKATIDKYKEKGLTYEQAKARLDKIDADYNDADLRELFNDKVEVVEQTDKEKVKKTTLTVRAYEGTFRDEVKKELEKFGLTRERQSFQEAEKQAKDIIERYGLDTALEIARSGDIGRAQSAEILNAKIEQTEKDLLTELDPQKISELFKQQAEAINELELFNLEGGRGSAQMAHILEKSDLGYNVEKKINDFKEQNGGEISEEVEKKFRELDVQFKEVKAKLIEAEKRAMEAEEKLAIDNIKESITREKKIKTYSKRGDDLIAEGVSELKKIFASFKDDKVGFAFDPKQEAEKRADRDKKLIIGLSKIGKGLIDKGIATIDNVFEKVKQYVKDNFGESIDIEPYKDDIVTGIKIKTPKATIKEGKVRVPHQLIRELVESGIDDINELSKEIKSRLKDEFPDVTIREIRDGITDYGRTINPNKEEIEEQIRKLKRIGKIESALEDVQNKKRPLRSGVQRDKPDTEERAKQKELREAMKELPMDEETLERELKTQLDAEKTRVQNRIDDLKSEIEKGEQVPRNARTVKADEELTKLKAELEKVKKEYDEKFKNDDYKEKKRLELSKKLTENRIQDLQRRLREGDFSKRAIKPLIADSELIKLRAEKLRIQEEYDKEFYKNKIKNRNRTEKFKDAVLEAWGLTRALGATGEFSFVLIQGGLNSIAHPSHAGQALKRAWQFFKSEPKTEQWLRETKAQEWYPVLKQSKLSLTEPHAEMSAREELFVSDWTRMLWNFIGTPLRVNEKLYDGWKRANPFKALERASVGYLDTIRVLRFLDGMEILKEKGYTPEKNPQEYKDVADVINTLTGRASLGRLEQNADLMAKVFFSPRNWASMLKQTILLPRQLYKWRNKTDKSGVSVANRMALADFSKYVGATTAMVAMFAVGLNNDDDDETSVETDPRSSDFGKIKIGDKRIDPWGGRIQQIVFMSRLLLDAVNYANGDVSEGGYKNKKGEITQLGVPYKSPSGTDLVISQAINKLSPSASLFQNFLSKVPKKDGTYETEYGEDYTLGSDIASKMLPIYWRTLSDLYKDDPSALNGLLAFYAFFGGGVNVYEDKKK